MSKTFFKNVVAGVAVTAMAFGAGAAANAAALSPETITLLNSLLGADVVAQILSATSSSASSSAGMSSYTNTATLSQGSSNSAAVMQLQSCLNMTGANLAVDGAFGPGTAAALRTFQMSKGMAADAVAGPMTNAALASACTSNASFEGGEESTPGEEGGEESTPGEEEGEEPTPGPEFDGSGDEVAFTGFDEDKASDTSVQEGASKVELGSIEFKNEDSDVLLERYDVVIVPGAAAVDGDDETDAYKAFDTIYLYVDGEKVAEMDTDSKSDWDDTTVTTVTSTTTSIDNSEENRVRFSGLNVVLEKDMDHEIAVYADIASSVDTDSNNESEWTLVFPVKAARFVDEASIVSYLVEDANVTEKSVDFEIVEAGNEDELQVTSSSNDPDATTLEIDSSNESDEHHVFSFDIEADKDGGTIEVSEIALSLDVSDVFDTVISEVTLKVGGEEEDYDTSKGSINAAAGVSTLVFDFDGSEFDINADEEIEAELYVRFNSTNSGVAYADGVTVQASVTSTDMAAWDAEGADDLTASQLSGSASGELHTLLENGAMVDVKSGIMALSATADGFVNNKATLTFGVEIESGSDTVYIPQAGLNAFTMNFVNASTGAATPLTAGVAVIDNSANEVDFGTCAGADTTAGAGTPDTVQPTTSAACLAADVTAGTWTADLYYEVSGSEMFDFVGVIDTVAGPVTAGLIYGELTEVNFSTLDSGVLTSATVPVANEKTNTDSIN